MDVAETKVCFFLFSTGNVSGSLNHARIKLIPPRINKKRKIIRQCRKYKIRLPKRGASMGASPCTIISAENACAASVPLKVSRIAERATTTPTHPPSA